MEGRRNFREGIFPNIQPAPPLVQPETTSSPFLASYAAEEADLHFSKASFQVVVENVKTSPEPSLLNVSFYMNKHTKILLVRSQTKGHFNTMPIYQYMWNWK